MAWMGHDEIRECFSSNSKPGRGWDALSQTGSVPTIVVGTRVRVVSGRKFTEFAAGDIGIVVRKDHSSGSCDVAFDGRPLPLPVAQRHLEVVPGTDTPLSPSTDVHDNNRLNDSNATVATYTRSSPEDGKPWDTPFTLAHGEAAALAEAVSASATATATATATAMAEVTALRLNIKDVRDRLTHEERSRRVGMQEMKLEIERLRAEHDTDCSVKADHQRLVQKQTELFSLCQSLKDEHADGLSALDGRIESIAQHVSGLDRMNVERDEMNLGRGHESGEVGVAGSLSVVRSQMELLSRRVDSLSREFSAEAKRLEALHANVAQSLGDQEHREDEMLKRLSLDAERHTASIHGSMAEVEQRTREAVMVGQRASDALEAHCAAARERDGLLNMLQVRVDALADGLGAESRLRSEAVARVESLCQMRDAEDGGTRARGESDQRLQASLADVHRTAEYAESKRREEVGKRLEAEATLHRLQAEFDGVRVQLGRQRQSPQRARLDSAEETVPFAMHDVSRMVSGPMREPSPAVTTVQGAVSTSLQGHAEPCLPETHWASMLRVSSAQGVPPPLPGARTPRTHWPAQPVVVTPGRLVRSASQPLPAASPVCVCGSAFLADAEFCRKCGSKRLWYPRLPDVSAPGPNSIPVDVEEVTSSGTVTPGSRSVIFPA